MPWPKTGATHYNAQLGLPDKGRAIKWLIVCWMYLNIIWVFSYSLFTLQLYILRFNCFFPNIIFSVVCFSVLSMVSKSDIIRVKTRTIMFICSATNTSLKYCEIFSHSLMKNFSKQAHTTSTPRYDFAHPLPWPRRNVLNNNWGLH